MSTLKSAAPFVSTLRAKYRASDSLVHAAAVSAVRPPVSLPVSRHRTHRGRRSHVAHARRGAYRLRFLEEFFHDEEVVDVEPNVLPVLGDGDRPLPSSSSSMRDVFTSSMRSRHDGPLVAAAGAHVPQSRSVHACGMRCRDDGPLVAATGAHRQGKFAACVSRDVSFSCPSAPNGDGQRDALFKHPAAEDREPTPNSAAASSELTFLHANLRAFRSKTTEITRLIERSGHPIFVFFTETWLDQASQQVSLAGYTQVSRKDRGSSAHGGVIVFAKFGFENTIVHIGDSKVTERSWHIIHSNRGPLLVGAWYRRPKRGEVLSIESLDQEIAEFGSEVVGTLLLGDMNVHEQSWLQFSDGTSPEGRALRDIACSHGLEERVRKPTRGPYLLDLVLTDLGAEVKARVIPGVSDHSAVIGCLKAMVDEDEPKTRVVYDFAKAPWDRIRDKLRSKTSWDSEFEGLNADKMAAKLERKITAVLDELVPTKTITESPSTHPWINDRCRKAIDEKMSAVGTPGEIAARDACSRIILEEHDKHIDRVRRKLSGLPRSSRGWWKLANALAGKQSKSSGIQPLKSETGVWARTSAEKAELLAATFLRKSSLPLEEENEYSAIGSEHFTEDIFLPIRCRDVCRVLRKMKIDSATGPDGVSTRVLKTCSDELAYPLALVIRAMVSEGCWPDTWRQHWIVGIYKKKSRADPSNYRGVHLTAQLSKAAERVIGAHFQKHLESSGAFGERQFAYTSGRGYGDALALSLLTWLLALERGNVVAIFCSDVSGAFDRVCSERLSAILATLRLHPKIHKLLTSWLEPRTSKVAVGGEFSKTTPLCNSVYQGTVWGSCLWNCYYASATKAVSKQGFTDIVFADDLNCTKVVESKYTNEEIINDAKECQAEVHRWGKGNRVLFDAGKESIHLLHRTRGQGENFKILGTEFDVALLMHDAAHSVSTEAGWRLKTLLRTRRYHSKHQMVHLYKAQILSYIESRTVGLHHAAPSTLLCVDRVQRRFLRELGITEEEALATWNLAPLPCRRAIAMLGLLYRIAMGLAPKPLRDLFPRDERVRQGPWTKGTRRRHSIQFLEQTTLGGHTDVFKRSCFGLITVWNMIPSEVVFSGSVRKFQKGLQDALRKRATETTDFAGFFTEAMRMTVPVFQGYFV